MTQAHPLQWPEGLARTERPATSQFKTALPVALNNVRKSLEAFGRDSGKGVSGIVLSSTRHRTDGVIDYERNRGEEWTLWRALVATVAVILDRRHRGGDYMASVDLGFWDSRSDGYGYSYGYLHLYPGWRVEVGTDGEMTW